MSMIREAPYETFFDAGLHLLAAFAPNRRSGLGHERSDWARTSDDWSGAEVDRRLDDLKSSWELLNADEQEQGNRWVQFVYEDMGPHDCPLVDLPVKPGSSGPPRANIMAWRSRPPEWPYFWDGMQCSWCDRWMLRGDVPGVCPDCGNEWKRVYLIEWYDSLRSLLSMHAKLKGQDHVLRRAERETVGKRWVGFVDKTTGLWHRYRYGKNGTRRWKAAHRSPEARESYFLHGEEP